MKEKKRVLFVQMGVWMVMVMAQVEVCEERFRRFVSGEGG